jgi:hypothetical protein
LLFVPHESPRGPPLAPPPPPPNFPRPQVYLSMVIRSPEEKVVCSVLHLQCLSSCERSAWHERYDYDGIPLRQPWTSGLARRAAR